MGVGAVQWEEGFGLQRNHSHGGGGGGAQFVEVMCHVVAEGACFVEEYYIQLSCYNDISCTGRSKS